MHLTPREMEKLMLHYAGEVAKQRKEKGFIFPRHCWSWRAKERVWQS